MPYAKKFQSDRDPKEQALMRQRWRLKKRRQRARRKAAAKKAIEEGRPVYRKRDSFIPSKAYPNRALWEVRRDMQLAVKMRKLPNGDKLVNAMEMTTTGRWRRKVFRTGVRGVSLPFANGSVLLSLLLQSFSSLRRGPANTISKKISHDSDSGHGSNLAPLKREEPPMEGKVPKFNPKTWAKDIQRVIEEAPRAPSQAGSPDIQHLSDALKGGFGKADRPPQARPFVKMPDEEEKRRKIEAMRKALLESEQKERQILRERQIEPEKPSPDGSLP